MAAAKQKLRRSSLLLTGLCGLCCCLAVLRFAERAFSLGPSGLAGSGAATRTARGRAARAALGPEALAAAEGALSGAAAALPAVDVGGLDGSLAVAFADQGTNINGILFQASLPAYLAFLYFLGWKGNKTPPLVQFGFAFLLLFVIATIPTGIISKSSYGVILADSDWLHGTAESLLTCTNIMLVLGFRAALQGDKEMADSGLVKGVAAAWLVAVVATLATGIPVFGYEVHTPFLAGAGAVEGMLAAPEPVNALSIPNWCVHYSTVFEFLLAMSLAWRYAEVTGNERWKGLSWGMLPSHCSSVAALTFHVFYNGVPWILTAQAFFTFFGNLTLAIAAARIASSNGWTISELNPFDSKEDKAEGDEAEEAASSSEGSEAPKVVNDLTPGWLLAIEVVLLTVTASYVTKYGELALAPGLFEANDTAATIAAAVIVATPPLLVLNLLVSKSPDVRQGKIPLFAGGES